MTASPPSRRANQLLGYPEDARLLIINADDFGMCHAVNEGVIRAFGAGVLSSTSLMVPCPWALHAMRFLGDHPEVAFGVHLTVVSEWSAYRWGSVVPKERVPSLLDGGGFFPDFEGIHDRLPTLELPELELEFRTQIETVLKAGLEPSHLDWHAVRLSGRDEISELMFELARDYGLALRVRGAAWTETVQSRGLPCNDYDFLDSYGLEPSDKANTYKKLLRELPPGLSEWEVHPALDTPELRAVEASDGAIRQSDFDFLISREAKAIIAEEDIILLDYRALQKVWRQSK